MVCCSKDSKQVKNTTDSFGDKQVAKNPPCSHVILATFSLFIVRTPQIYSVRMGVDTLSFFHLKFGTQDLKPTKNKMKIIHLTNSSYLNEEIKYHFSNLKEHFFYVNVIFGAGFKQRYNHGIGKPSSVFSNNYFTFWSIIFIPDYKKTNIQN